MNERKRITAALDEGARKLGSQAALGRYLGVTPSTVTEYFKERAIPSGLVLMKLQDLIKRAACVLLAIGLSTASQTPEAKDGLLALPSSMPGGPALTRENPCVLCKMIYRTESADLPRA